MLVYLCDECHGSMSAEEFRDQEAAGHRRHLCARCRARVALPENKPSSKPATPPEPTPPRLSVPDCSGCAVAERQKRIPGASWGDRSNAFCASCEKVSHMPSTKFRCHMCKSLVELEDIRLGFAETRDEKVFCSTCKRRSKIPPLGTEPPPPEPVVKVGKPLKNRQGTRTFAAARAADGPPPPVGEPRDRPPTQSIPRPTGGGLECDLCHRPFNLEELRSGKAEIREARVLCPRCIARIDRRRQHLDIRFVGSLAFILVIFPVTAAILVYLAVTGGGGEDAGNIDLRPRDGGAVSPRIPAPGAPSPAPPSPATAPGEKKTPEPIDPEDNIRGLPREALDQIIKNLRDESGAAAPPRVAPPLADPLPGSRGPVAILDPEKARDMLSSADSAVRMEGALRLASNGAGADALLEALKDPDPFVRSIAASALGRRRQADAAGPLLALIRDADPGVRKAASLALLDIVNINVRYVEDFSRDELERLKGKLEDILKEKTGK